MDWHQIFAEPFSHQFMRDAFRMGLVIAVMCGGLGVLLVPRGLSMLGDGIAHATMGGVGIALLAGLSPEVSLWVAMPFAVFVALGITWLGRHARITGDAALGVFFAVSLAIGIAAVHLAARRGAVIDIESLLFGNILAVDSLDVDLIVILSFVVMVALAWFGPRIAYAGFYPDLASMNGIRTTLKEYILMILTAVVTVTAVRAVGVLLVSAYLVLPTVTAKMVARRLGPLMLLSICAGILGSALGLILSYHFDIPTGSAMTLSLGGLFVFALGARGLGRQRS